MTNFMQGQFKKIVSGWLVCEISMLKLVLVFTDLSMRDQSWGFIQKKPISSSSTKATKTEWTTEPEKSFFPRSQLTSFNLNTCSSYWCDDD